LHKLKKKKRNMERINRGRKKGWGKTEKEHQPVLPDKSPERALPYEADPVCEVAPLAFETVVTRAFWICRILKASLGSGWLWTVAVSSFSCPIYKRSHGSISKICFSNI